MRKSKRQAIEEANIALQKRNLTEGLSDSENLRNAAIYRGNEVFEKFLSNSGIDYNVDSLGEIAKYLIIGINSALESHYTDMAPNAGAAPDEMY